MSHLSHFAPTKEHHLVAGKRPQKPLEYPHRSRTRPQSSAKLYESERLPRGFAARH